MKTPVPDGRSLDDLRAQMTRLAKAYTPEWRLGSPAEDPGAAIAELFCEMHHQTIQRWNTVPEKLYLEFLNQIGFHEPGPSASQGTMRFNPAATVEEPVSVPAGTQVFTPDAAGENIVFETVRPIQATAAVLSDIFYTDAENDEIRLLNMDAPRRFFAPEGEIIQRHLLSLGQTDALLLDCPCVITLRPRREAQYLEEEAVRSLTAQGLHWFFRHEGEDIPFDKVRGEKNTVVLEKRNHLSVDAVPTGPDEHPARCVYCQGRPAGELTLEAVTISSAPMEDCSAQTLFSGDIPMNREEGDYCFSRRPSPYSMFYLRSDTVLSKRTALARLRLNLTFVVDNPPPQEVPVVYGQAVIDRQGAVAPKPDDVYVSGVVWEYFNGLGWRNLVVAGNRNPFAGLESGQGEIEITFTVPADLTEVEVNAEPGLYIRARVTEVMNLYSALQKWIVPFVKEASFSWQYEKPPQADWAAAENNGSGTEIPQAEDMASWNLPAFRMMEPGEQAMYFRFDRSPHAMPLSVRFWLDGRTRLEEKLQWETRTASGFEPVQCVDRTENLLHSGEMFLFLPTPLEETELFGRRGCWLRLRRTSYRPGAQPVVRKVELNTVGAVQIQQQAAQIFDTGVYEPDKSVTVLYAPVQSCRVWVDELSALTEEEAHTLAKEWKNRVVLEEDGQRLSRCWVLWDLISDLALAGPKDRVCTLDPWTGVFRFGDDTCGRVPPQGAGNIRIEYAVTQGAAGNVPEGTVDAPLMGLPRISSMSNVTPMSGGTGRLDLNQLEAMGSRRLRHRGRACGRRDFEDIVADLFPQVRHVRCFPGRDQRGADAPGHVTVTVAGQGEQGESLDALCQQVYGELSRRCSCCLVAEGRLHVCPAVELTVNIRVSVELERPDYAAETQQNLVRRLDRLITDLWQARPIGEQIRMAEIWTAVRETENVRSIRQVLAEAAWYDEGRPRLAPLDFRNDFPYSIVKNGTHTVRLV